MTKLGDNQGLLVQHREGYKGFIQKLKTVFGRPLITQSGMYRVWVYHQ